MSEFNKFDEYKFFAESTNTLSERRQAATQTYLTVNTAIFGVIAFLVKDAQLVDWNLLFGILPLVAVGVVACIIWLKIILQYKKLINWRYDQLMTIENDLCAQGAYGFYLKEYEDLFKRQQGKEKFGFSRWERLLPILILVLYAYGLIGVTLIAAF
jgi:hypothetical protein